MKNHFTLKDIEGWMNLHNLQFEETGYVGNGTYYLGNGIYTGKAGWDRYKELLIKTALEERT